MVLVCRSQLSPWELELWMERRCITNQVNLCTSIDRTPYFNEQLEVERRCIFDHWASTKALEAYINWIPKTGNSLTDLKNVVIQKIESSNRILLYTALFLAY